MGHVHIFPQANAGRVMTAGEVFFEAGDPGDVMYVVLDGEVDLVIGGRRVETVRPGGVFGELALIDDAPRSGLARARTSGRVVPVDRDQFEFLIHEHPSFAVEVMSIMAARLRRREQPGANPAEEQGNGSSQS